jgi:hypothetical protein
MTGLIIGDIPACIEICSLGYISHSLGDAEHQLDVLRTRNGDVDLSMEKLRAEDMIPATVIQC